MLRFLGAALGLLLACTSVRAESLLLDGSQSSPALGRPFRYTVYLPDGYSRGDLRYPVLYLLHGAGGDEHSWVTEGAIKETADRMISAGTIPPAIIVMPGCIGCWWVDGTVDKAETAFWNDLVPAIADKYRTIPGRRGMVIGGLSAGGYGAVRFALGHPDRIAAVAALSPAVYADTPPAISSARSQPPFRRADGAFDAAAWKAKNYPSLIDAYFRQPKRVAFYLVSGDNDAYGIAFETVALFKRLYERQPALSELRIVDGDHSWSIWASAIPGAMTYLFKQVDKPQPLLVASAPTNSKLPVSAPKLPVSTAKQAAATTTIAMPRPLALPGAFMP